MHLWNFVDLQPINLAMEGKWKRPRGRKYFDATFVGPFSLSLPLFHTKIASSLLVCESWLFFLSHSNCSLNSCWCEPRDQTERNEISIFTWWVNFSLVIYTILFVSLLFLFNFYSIREQFKWVPNKITCDLVTCKVSITRITPLNNFLSHL